MNRGYYRVELIAGEHTWTITHHPEDDHPPFAYGPTGNLRFGWAFDDDALPTDPPQPPTASFGVVVEHAHDIDILVDDPVAIRVWLTPATGTPAGCDWSFYGRVTEVDAQPHRRGFLVNVMAAGYYTDLNGHTIGDEPWQDNQWVRERITQILTLTDHTASWPASSNGPSLAGRDVDAQPAGELLREYVRQFVATRPGTIVYPPAGGYTIRGHVSGQPPAVPWPLIGPALAGLVPHIYATDTGPGRPAGQLLAFDWHTPDRHTPTPAHPLPATLAATAGGVGIELPDTAAAAIPADLVDFTTVAWRRSRDERTTDVRVSYQEYDGNIFPPNPPEPAALTVRRRPVERVTTQRVTTEHVHPIQVTPINPIRLGALVLPSGGEWDGWEADTLRVHLWRDPDALAYVIPNAADHRNAAPVDRASLYTRPLAIVGIPDRHNPTGDPWVAGQVRGADFVIENRRYYVDLRLSRTVPRLMPDHTSSRAYTAPADPAWASVRPVDLDPAFSVYDYRLVGRIT